MPRTVTCACCNEEGPHKARGLIEKCWSRHWRARDLDRFPRICPPPGQGRRNRPRVTRPADDVLDAYVERVRGASPGVSLALVAADIGMQRKTLHKVLQRARRRGDARADVRLPWASTNQYRRFREMLSNR